MGCSGDPLAAANGPTRRALLAGFGAGAALAVGGVAPAAAQRPVWRPQGALAYRVTLAGNDIGRLAIAFEPDGDRLVARLAVDISVDIAFINAWSYRLRAVETWAGDRLVAYSSTADDDGRPHTLEGVAVEDGFRLASTRDGQPYLSELAPPDAATPAYWRRDTLARTTLFDPQDGSLHGQTVLGHRREVVEAAGRSIRAQAYNVEARNEGWVWYEDTGRWLAAAFRYGGFTIRQTLIG